MATAAVRVLYLISIYRARTPSCTTKNLVILLTCAHARKIGYINARSTSEVFGRVEISRTPSRRWLRSALQPATAV